MDAAAEHPWRCFVAVPIGAELRSRLEQLVDRLGGGAGEGAWRWSEPESWHVTLAFLGATDPGRVPRLTEALADVAAPETAFALQGWGMGTFPSRSRARVLWYGFGDPDRRLARLAREVQRVTELDPAARFRAHLTLARARERFGTDASAILARAGRTQGQLDVDRLVLYRSHLGRGPARYEPLASVRLGGGQA